MQRRPFRHGHPAMRRGGGRVLPLRRPTDTCGPAPMGPAPKRAEPVSTAPADPARRRPPRPRTTVDPAYFLLSLSCLSAAGTLIYFALK